MHVALFHVGDVSAEFANKMAGEVRNSVDQGTSYLRKFGYATFTTSSSYNFGPEQFKYWYTLLWNRWIFHVKRIEKRPNNRKYNVMHISNTSYHNNVQIVS